MGTEHLDRAGSAARVGRARVGRQFEVPPVGAAGRAWGPVRPIWAITGAPAPVSSRGAIKALRSVEDWTRRGAGDTADRDQGASL